MSPGPQFRPVLRKSPDQVPVGWSSGLSVYVAGGYQQVQWSGPPCHRSLGTHRVPLAGQAPSAAAAVRLHDAALTLDVDAIYDRKELFSIRCGDVRVRHGAIADYFFGAYLAGPR